MTQSLRHVATPALTADVIHLIKDIDVTLTVQRRQNLLHRLFRPIPVTHFRPGFHQPEGSGEKGPLLLPVAAVCLQHGAAVAQLLPDSVVGGEHPLRINRIAIAVNQRQRGVQASITADVEEVFLLRF